jgi:hypothetical protein
MIEATIILLNMRGGCATIGNQVHALFRLNNRHSLARHVEDRIDARQLDRPAEPECAPDMPSAT